MKQVLKEQEERIREDQKNENIFAHLNDKEIIDENENII